jgi:ABC-type multidrug transport system permease subunit
LRRPARRWRGPISQKSHKPVGNHSDAGFYLLAALCGIATGCIDVAVNDLLFTALLVLMACMLLGMLRPRWPWRWVVVVVTLIPVAELAAYLVLTVKPTRGQVYGSFLTALPGTAGAYGGAVVRNVIEKLRSGG